jgi:tetratricopeptide (TPR) repeat protein
MPDRIAKRLLIVGWDAADWKVIDTILSLGGMPNLRRLVDQGVRANLASLEPRLSPLLWTSIATGKTADKHGILNFVEPDPSGEGLRIASSTSRKTKAIWNILTQSGMRSNVVGWYASHPAEPINGGCVSNMLMEGMPRAVGEPWPMPPGTVHPADFAGRIADLRMHTGELTAEDISAFLPRLAEIEPTDSRPALLARELAHCVSVHNVVTSLLENDQSWDCTMVFYDAIDSVGHNFMQYHPPRMPHVSQRDFELYGEVMASVYQFHDMLLGRLIDLAGSETALILLSDHGFFSDHRRPVIHDMTNEQRAMVEASWHRPLGILVMAGPGIARQKQVFGASLLDITPTALALLGLPVGADMSGRVLAEALTPNVRVESLFSWDMQPGSAGMHPPDLRQDPFEARDAINQLVDLGYMSPLPDDAKAKHDLAWRETQCNLATVLTFSGAPDHAVPVLQELVKRYPAERRYLVSLARTLFVAARYEECAGLLREFVQRNPLDHAAGIMFGIALAHSESTDEAAEVLDSLVVQVGDRADMAGALGDIAVAIGKWEDAERHYRRALQFDPDSAGVHHGLARAAIGQQKFEEAVDECLTAVQLVHVFPDAHHSLGVALTWMKDYEHAIKAFNVALSMRPSLLDSHRYLATVYRQVGDAENARKHREIAEQLMDERKAGKINWALVKRQSPLGPQEWANRMSASGG